MEKIKAENGVVFYRSLLLKSPHAFSTRIGGVSTAGVLKGLNLTVTQRDGETRKNVMVNLARFCEAIGISKNKILSLPACNGEYILEATKDDLLKSYYNAPELAAFAHYKKGFDGYVTQERDVAIGMKTADCLPVLFEYLENELHVVASAHVGCKDDETNPMCNIHNITQLVIEKLLFLGAAPQNIRVALGPCVHTCCCMTSNIIISILEKELGVTKVAQYCKRSGEGTWSVDMIKMNYDFIVDIGILPSNIDVCDVCTACNTDVFYSRFKEGKKTGSMLSVIALPEE